MNNILTINIEDYYQVGAFSHLIPYREWERFEDRIRRNTDKALELLAAAGAQATFFVSGWIAEKHGDLLHSVLAAGHEVAAQGYYQQSIRGVPPTVFREDVRRARATIEAATGRAVLGFRIGRGWIGPDDLWALDIIRDEGFAYDSSLCPLGAQFRGERQRFSLHPVGDGADPLIEVPASSLSLGGFAVPFAGGNYLRQLPRTLTGWASQHWVVKRQLPLVAYFHVWELDDAQPHITAAGPLQRLRQYRNLATMHGRILELLATYRFVSVQDYLRLEQPPIDAAATAPPPAPASAPAAAISDGRAELPLSIVVPCFNEEASIPYLARTLDAFAAATRGRFALDFIFVDDGSSDATWNSLGRTFGNRGDARLLRHPVNRGIAAAIMSGIAAATTDLVAVIDADCTFDPFQLESMLALLADDISVVVASPFHPHGAVRNVPGWRLLLSRAATALYRRVFHNQLSSYTSCFRIYRRQALAGIHIANSGFCGVTEILAHLDVAGHRIVECPVVLQVRLLGQSKIRLLRVTFDHLGLFARLVGRRLFSIPLPHERST